MTLFARPRTVAAVAAAVASSIASSVGGRRRLSAIGLLSGSLALAAADQTIAGAVAPDLKIALHVDNTGIGLLVTAAYLLAAVCTVPFGILADRTHRVRVLAICALSWSGAITLAGFAHSYPMLLAAQMLLGAGVGGAAPLVASLAGDVFPPGVRGRALGFILAGEFAGAASGLLLAGEIAAYWPWRASFFALATLGPALAVLLLRFLPEPARGAQRAGTAEPTHTAVAAAVRARGIEPRARLVLHQDPAGRPLSWAVRYVLAVPTNVVIIVASALCYFYVAGVQTFAIVFLRGRFDLSQQLATALLVVIGIGVIGGILVTGHVSDRLIARGHPAARLTTGGICFLAAVVAFVPGFSVTTVALAVPLLFLGAAGLGGLNPPLDAARLDVVHFRLWGRAESVRAMAQNLIRAGAPLLFGYLSTVLDAGTGAPGHAAGGGAVGLTRAFLVLLGLFVVGGAVLLAARRAYLRDVATAVASEIATSSGRP